MLPRSVVASACRIAMWVSTVAWSNRQTTGESAIASRLHSRPASPALAVSPRFSAGDRLDCVREAGAGYAAGSGRPSGPGARQPRRRTRSRCLTALERKVLWLSTWMIHNANHLRPNRDGLKVGGHQASSASVATLMTALYFDVLRPQDRVAVKPHASPVFHAIQYLFGPPEPREAGAVPRVRRRAILSVAHQGRRRPSISRPARSASASA